MGGLLLRPGFFTGSCPARARADQPKASTAKTTARAAESVIAIPRTYRPLTTNPAQRSSLAPDVVAMLVAEALRQAHFAGGAIDGLVIPRLPPQRRGLATDTLRRLDGTLVFCNGFLRDLESFIAILEALIDAGTTVYWQADEHHIAGGYEVTTRDDAAQALASALHELGLVRDRLVAASSAVRAVREIDGLL